MFFFFNDTATTEIYTLSLHDALPICDIVLGDAIAMQELKQNADRLCFAIAGAGGVTPPVHFRLKRLQRSEEHTSELQSRQYLVCRLLLEKKKKQTNNDYTCCTTSARI